ncbi:arylsulfatase [Vibrio jasicida]|uniref:arylsulfatase n=1 Tax=Vibrio jasicida TaxID=766224 RepID=UPI003F73CBC3
MKGMKRKVSVSLLGMVLSSVALANDPPNIVVIFGDDIGWQNVSAYGMGTMGYKTPNIDRIANDGILFTDHYAQPSCTAGRAAFITGQYPIRSGMTTVAMPGGALGIKKESPSLAEVLKQEGYATGQFGKNHLGDHNFALPTNHGFDEFFGNLYHLNTQEEHEQRDYINFAKAYSGSIEEYAKKFGTRGVLHCHTTETEDTTIDPRFGVVGKQKCKDTGPLGSERMKNFDRTEMLPKAIEFIDRAVKDEKPFFTWINTSRMHLYTRLDEKWRYAAENYTSEYDFYGSGMLQHDDDIGFLLAELDKRKLTKNTIIVYTTDNGPEHSSWPHGGTSPYRGEKMTTYEGGVRVPAIVSWPAALPSGKILNGIQGHQDLFTTLASAAGVEDVNAKLLKDKKQYIDGVDNLDYWKGDAQESSRKSILYYFEGQLSAIRIGPWKFHFAVAEHYYDNLVPLSKPKLYNLRADPFESYDSIDANGHLIQKMSWLLAPVSEIVKEHVQSLVEYPPTQGGSTFDMAEVIEEAMKKTQQ